MRRNFVLGFLILCAAFFALTSGSSLSAPAEFANRIGYSLITRDGFNEIRAQYGGVFLAACITNLAAILRRVPRRAALLVDSTVFGGLIGGRLMSLVFDGGPGAYSSFIDALYFIDATGFFLSIAALLSERPPEHEH
jgi:uncharacterized protein DUF4345